MKKLKSLLALTLAFVLLFSLMPTALAAEVSLPLYNRNGQMVADEGTKYITLFKQDPETKLITATVQVQNNTATTNTIVLSTVCTEITFSDKVAPYNRIPGSEGIYLGELKTGAGTLAGYYKNLTSFEQISPEIIQNDNGARVVSSKVTTSDSDKYLRIPAGATADVIEYYFMPVNGTDNLSLDMFSYEYGVHKLYKASTWIGLSGYLLLSNSEVAMSIDEYVVKGQAFKIHVQHPEPAVSADNSGRTVTGYNPATMEWSSTANGTYASTVPSISDGEQTIYVRVKGDTAYSGADAEYGAYKMYVPSSPVAVKFEAKGQSAIPTIDPVTEGASKITGTGVPGANIVVTLPNGPEIEVPVGSDGKWSVDVPAGKEPNANEQIKAVQTEPGKTASDPATETVQPKPKSKNPTVDPITEGDDKIKGKGEPGADIIVKLPGGPEIETEVDENGNWSVDVPNDKELKKDEEVKVIQIEDGKNPSDEVIVTVQDPGDSKMPTINPVTEGDARITGTGVPGAGIEVTFPGGSTASATVDPSGNWGVDAPSNLVAGNEVKAVQTEEGKRPSDPRTETVQTKIITGAKMSLSKTSENLTTTDGKNRVGDTLKYTITVQSTGPAGTTLSDTVVTDALPEGVSYDADSVRINDSPAGSAAIYDTAGRTLTVALGDIPAGEQRVLTFTVTIVSGNITIKNGVTVTAKDGNSGNVITDHTDEPGDGKYVEPRLETEDHRKYLNGYTDGSVRPDNTITRAEVAAIFYRLLTTQGTAIGGQFKDVPNNQWYSQSVNYLGSIGILNGYEDGTFQPDKPITRAEFAAIASRFDNLASSSHNVFSDVKPNHWAISYINSAYAKGWINGYSDGTFRPEKNISRAEVVKIVNAMLNRAVDSAALAKITNPYNDLRGNHWAYAEIIEASMVHEYIRDDSGKEIWQSW